MLAFAPAGLPLTRYLPSESDRCSRRKNRAFARIAHAMPSGTYAATAAGVDDFRQCAVGANGNP